MADEDKAKAEKLAAAKKRVEALKKKKQGGGGAASGKGGDKKDKKDKAPADTKPVETVEAEEAAADDDTKKAKTKKGGKDDKGDNADATADANTTADTTAEPGADDVVGSPTSPKAAAAVPSLSEQSHLRSASFRHGGASGPLSPTADGETAADIYRKQVARIEELERQNKRLAQAAADAESRWQKAEDVLADTRDGTDSGEVAKLQAEIAALKRQNTQLQARSSARHGSSPSMSLSTPPASELETQLRSKTQTIENMELEMSRLRAQVERLSMTGGGADGEDEGEDDGDGGDSPKKARPGRNEQVAALEEKLARAERAAGTAQRELAELKRNLDRAADKAVREGSARTSAETQVRALEEEVAALRMARDEAVRRADGLDKKVATLATLHKEHDARAQALRRDKERVDRDLADAHARLSRADAELLRLRKRDAHDSGGTDDDHLDELLAASPDDAARLNQLARQVRALEAENADLRHGIWQDRRKELQLGPDDEAPGTGRHFSDVDLSPQSSRKGTASAGGGGGGGVGGGLGEFFSALTGGGGDHHGHGHGHGHSHTYSHGGVGGDDDGFLDDDDMDFDEEAFRRAHEEEARQRLERVKEVKRSLKNWEGWRLDLVESRQGGAEGIGPIFEI